MTLPTPEKDERATAIENAAHKLGYNVATYLLLVDVMVRTIRGGGQAPWDLFAILIVSSLAITAYQARWKATIPIPKWLKWSLIALTLAPPLGVGPGASGI